MKTSQNSLKTSQKSLLSAVGALFAIVVLFIASGRVAVSNADVQPIEPGERYSIASDLANFDKIDISGSWEVELIQGDSWNVDLSSAEESSGRIEVSVSNGTLNLSQRSSFNLWGSGSDPVATVQMPNLSELDIAGASEVEIVGFEGEELDVDVAGAIEITAKESRYTNLMIDGAGAVDVEFKGLIATNAQIDMSGASDMTLTMDGGELTGDISGAGSVDYYGSVSKQSIDISGAGSIEHQD